MGNFFAKLLPSPTLPTDQADRAPDQQPDQAPQIDTISEDAEDQGTQPDSVSGDAEDQAVQRDAVSEGIEEGKAAYQPGGFHPVYIGNIFNDRYKVLNKIGYGQYSTVWLVKDLQASGNEPSAFRALKVLSAVCYSQGYDTFEKEILTHLRDGDRDQLGYNYVCHLVDNFEHQGRNGTHTCLVFELMGETLRSFGVWFSEHMIPPSIMHRFAIQLVLALDFAHEHDVIHTDIKPDNIFVKFRDHSLIESGYLKEVPIPEQDREETQYCPVPSQPLRGYYFDTETIRADQFDIALGDWGVSSWTTKHLCETIQPVALRSPEVLIGAPWSASTDWWNLGAVLIEVFRAVRLFDGGVPPDGHYELKEHLIEIVDLFGPFPKALLEKGNQDVVRDLFDEEGCVKDAEPYEGPGLESEAYLPGLSLEMKADFSSFLDLMMKIDPEERPSAMDLLRHPWLNAVR
ncbi:Protein kinase domain-containing protein [Fusarium keratoplasticum]|uniref:Protein kinase domain-containing protein n=1 Tax=Fusarium keratoplasticum TaxID=1328300 RepID=A0ACC0QFX5_9HYPO|nr:Protein kinase domain-containing protein [Fusarium keratoplasticum]KAI8652250.1 Protein kinase domain-containing protein [Fusarium keratoplasticum]KAI8652991.1 Protein kinase domain-containing protein [Fusarium keratoplasticum]